MVGGLVGADGGDLPGADVRRALHVLRRRHRAMLIVNLVTLLRPGQWSFREFVAPLQRVLNSYIDMITDMRCCWRRCRS